MASTTVSVDIVGKDRASAAFRTAGRSADTTAARFAKFGKAAKLAAIGLGGFGAAAAVFTYKVGSSYVNSLNQIQALTGANNKQMTAAAKILESNASRYAKMGQTTGDAAAGVVELTKAGLSLHDSLKAVNATMTLAKAGELEVGDASSLVANSLNTFGLKAKSAGKLANQLANAANISSADVSDLAESFKYVSPVAASAGVSMGETAAIMAELSNSGIKASQAGTTLRTFLLNLQAPAAAGAAALKDLNIQVFDAQGNMKPLPTVIDDLGGALNGLPAKEKAADLKAIFGKTGIAGATTILKEGKAGLADYERGVNKAGAANKLAQAKSKGLAGTFASIKSQLVSAAQGIYREYSPALDKRLRTFIQQFKDGKGAGGGFRDALSDVKDIAQDLWPVMQKTAHWTGTFLDYLATHKKTLEAFAATLLVLKGASMAKSSGVFSLGKGIAGKALGSTVGGGVQKVFVVNPGFGSGGGPGGTVGGAVTKAGGLLGVAKWLGLNVAAPIGFGSQFKHETTSGTQVTGKIGNAADLRALTRMTDATDALRAHAAKASQSLEMIGPHAQGASKKAVAAIHSVAGRDGLDAIGSHAAGAMGAFAKTGASAVAAASRAVGAIGKIPNALNAIHDKTVRVTANTSQAMQNLSVMRYQLDQLHDKTIIVRAIGGHVPGEPTGGGGSGGSGGSAGGGSSFGRAAVSPSEHLMRDLVDGISHGFVPLRSAFSKVESYLAKEKGKLKSLLSERAGFASGFQSFTSSVFGADLSHTTTDALGNGTSTPGTISDILSYQTGQRDKARSLKADVARLHKMGLSNALIKQLQASGEAGIAQIHTLAGGSKADISRLNTLDKQTRDALHGAGDIASAQLYNSQIQQTRNNEDLAERIAKKLHARLQESKKDERLVITDANGQWLIKAIKKDNRVRNGGKN